MLISISEYADRVGRDRSAVSKKLRNGDFKTAVRIGHNWFIDADEPYTRNKPGRKTARETTDYIIVFGVRRWMPGSGYSTPETICAQRTVTADKGPVQLLKTIDWSWIDRRKTTETTDREWSATLYAADDAALERPIARRSVWESDLT